mgnify:CR=1 FL=1
MTRRYFGTDGVRGCVGEPPITPELVLKLGWAAGLVLAADTSRDGVRPGVLVRLESAEVTFRQRFVPQTDNLQFLSCGEYTVPPGCTSVKSASAVRRSRFTSVSQDHRDEQAPKRETVVVWLSAPRDRPAWCGMCIPPLGVRCSLTG